MSRARKREDMNGSSFGVVSAGAGAGAERSAGERSEPQRSGATVPAGALPASRPDPEVVARPKRRSYTAEYKLRVLQQAEAAAATPGGGRRPSPSRRSVLLSAGLLAARAGPWNPGGLDSAEAWA